MSPSTWSEVKRVFGDALDLPADARESFVRGRAQDPQVQDDVLRLLRRHAGLSRFLEIQSPPSGEDAPASESVGARVCSTTQSANTSCARTDGMMRLAPGAVLAGRYELGARLGAGAFGAVHRATDRLTRSDVAVKILALADPRDFQAMRRELTILRRARLPGLVELLDDGVEQGHAFLVMRLIDGVPFPGSLPREAESDFVSWQALRQRAILLIEALARLHWLGVLHRDLKPQNVLVDADGSVTIVDLGVARDAAGAGDAAAYLIGTPAYIAPERIDGRPATVSSDLYSIGAMLYELLAARPPRDVVTLDDLLAVGTAETPALADVAPHVPRHVAQTIDALLLRDPALRPASARAVAAMLSGGAPDEHEIRLPYLGDDGAVRAVVRSVEEGRSLDLAGPAGCGRTRTLDEAQRRLRATGRRVLRTCPGSAPFESMSPLVGRPETRPECSLEHLREEMRRTVGSWLDAKVAILADDWEELDAESRDVLNSVRGRGPIVRVLGVASDGALVPTPRTEADLRPLFRGLDRLLHIREDASRELHRRTLGSPDAIAREIDLWVSNGIARFEEGRVEIDRPGIERLQTRFRFSLPQAGASGAGLSRECRDVQGILEIAAGAIPATCVAELLQRTLWRVEADIEELARRGVARRDDDGAPCAVLSTDAASAWTGARRATAHAAISRTLPRADLRRLIHLDASGDGVAFAVEATEAARRLLLEGRTVAAFELASDAATAIRSCRASGSIRALDALDLVVESALALANERSIEMAGYHAGLAALDDARARPHEVLCRAALLTIRGDSQRALDCLSEPLARDAETIERLRHVVRVLAARQLSPALERSEVAALARWARRCRSREARALLTVSIAWVRYRGGLYVHAARRHARAARASGGQASLVLGLLNAASAAMEAGLLDEAAQHARIARQRAESLRIPMSEARAIWLERCIAYRAGQVSEADSGIVDAAAALGAPQLVQLLALNEAAIAWRSGSVEIAHALALRARAAQSGTGRPWVRLLADALIWASGDAASLSDRNEFAARVCSCGVPGVALQVAGLAAPAIGLETAQAVWRAARPAFDDVTAARRREIISITEVDERLERFLGTRAGTWLPGEGRSTVSETRRNPAVPLAEFKGTKEFPAADVRRWAEWIVEFRWGDAADFARGKMSEVSPYYFRRPMGTGLMLDNGRTMTCDHIFSPPHRVEFPLQGKRKAPFKVVTAAARGVFGRRHAPSNHVERQIGHVSPWGSIVDVAFVDFVAAASSGAAAAGGASLKHSALPVVGAPVCVLHHAGGGPLVVSLGSITAVDPAGNWFRHDAATRGGSSGAPVFAPGGALLGIHRGVDDQSGASEAVALTVSVVQRYTKPDGAGGGKTSPAKAPNRHLLGRPPRKRQEIDVGTFDIFNRNPSTNPVVACCWVADDESHEAWAMNRADFTNAGTTGDDHLYFAEYEQNNAPRDWWMDYGGQFPSEPAWDDSASWLTNWRAWAALQLGIQELDVKFVYHSRFDSPQP